jgi:hypothetical protein
VVDAGSLDGPSTPQAAATLAWLLFDRRGSVTHDRNERVDQDLSG